MSEFHKEIWNRAAKKGFENFIRRYDSDLLKNSCRVPDWVNFCEIWLRISSDCKLRIWHSLPVKLKVTYKETDILRSKAGANKQTEWKVIFIILKSPMASFIHLVIFFPSETKGHFEVQGRKSQNCYKGNRVSDCILTIYFNYSYHHNLELSCTRTFTFSSPGTDQDSIAKLNASLPLPNVT